MYKGKFEQNQNSGAPRASRIQPAAENTPAEQPRSNVEPKVEPRTGAEPRVEPRSDRVPQRNPRRKPQKGIQLQLHATKGAYIFYGIYVGLALLFFIGVAIAMGALKDWLVTYQAAQPETKSQQVFQQLFSDPDWSEIYAIANPDNTNPEIKQAYADYMAEQVGDDELTFIETAAGLSGDKKYYVLHGKKVISTFSLTADDKDAEIPDWRLGDVEVYFYCNRSFNIQVLPGCTVTVNGKTLDDSHIIRKVATKAEAYLPSGTQGFRLVEYRVSGLYSVPEVTVADKSGNSVEVTFDEQTGVFAQVLPEAPAIAQDEYDVVLGAAKAYTEFMVKGGTAGLRKYFDTSSKIYSTITGGMIIRQSYTGYEYQPEEITEYYKYRDGLFSARIKLITEVTSKYGVKNFEVDSTFIYSKVNGKWVVHDMLNMALQEQVEEVRLTFKDDQGNVISSELVSADTKTLTVPTIKTPEGQEFLGWYEEVIDAQGNTSLTPYFTNVTNGQVTVTDSLHAMVLVPYFEAKEAA